MDVLNKEEGQRALNAILDDEKMSMPVKLIKTTALALGSETTVLLTCDGNGKIDIHSILYAPNPRLEEVAAKLESYALHLRTVAAHNIAEFKQTKTH